MGKGSSKHDTKGYSKLTDDDAKRMQEEDRMKKEAELWNRVSVSDREALIDFNKNSTKKKSNKH